MKIISIPNITFNQNYQADEEGNIWSPYGGLHKLSPSATKKGYFRIVLQTSEGRKTFQVHRLILMTFNPVENMENLEVNHINGDKSDNSLKNLEWCSGSFNVRHSLQTGLKVPARGEQVGGNVLTEQQVLEICKRLQIGVESLAQIGKDYGVSKYCIFDIKRKKSWDWLTKDFNFNQGSTTIPKGSTLKQVETGDPRNG